MKKRILAVMVASALVAASLSGCGEDTESTPNQSGNSSSSQAKNESAPSSNKPESSSNSESLENSEESTITLKIKDYKLSKDYKDKDVLVVNYELYNGKETEEAFSNIFTDTAYQNGVECDDIVVGCDDVDAKTQIVKIQPGIRYIIKVGYHIKDKSDVTIKVTPTIGEGTVLEETLKIDQ